MTLKAKEVSGVVVAFKYGDFRIDCRIPHTLEDQALYLQRGLMNGADVGDVVLLSLNSRGQYEVVEINGHAC